MELDQQEIWDYGGHINYIAHHEVINPRSVLTKLRIMSNFSLENNNTRISFNDLHAKRLKSLIHLIEAVVS